MAPAARLALAVRPIRGAVVAAKGTLGLSFWRNPTHIYVLKDVLIPRLAVVLNVTGWQSVKED